MEDCGFGVILTVARSMVVSERITSEYSAIWRCWLFELMKDTNILFGDLS